jgi:hypothetical protein
MGERHSRRGVGLSYLEEKEGELKLCRDFMFLHLGLKKE